MYAFHPGYPDTTVLGSMLALYKMQREDMPQVCILFGMDAKGQTLEEKIGRGRVCWGMGRRSHAL